MFFRLIFISLALTISSTSCTGTKKNVSTNQGNPLLLKVRTTACYGRCPVYTAVINKEFQVSISPIKFCSFDSTKSRILSKTEQSEFVKLLNQINLDTLRPNYSDKLLQDIPSVYYTFYNQNDSIQTITNTSNPKTLHNYYLFINEVFKEMNDMKR
jgi:hypothetical protein